jgi:hypothetical protein
LLQFVASMLCTNFFHWAECTLVALAGVRKQTNKKAIGRCKCLCAQKMLPTEILLFTGDILDFDSEK